MTQPRSDRDTRGRFARGNQVSSAGGHARAAGAGRPGSPLRPIATHPGAIQDWIAQQWTPSLFGEVAR